MLNLGHPLAIGELVEIAVFQIQNYSKVETMRFTLHIHLKFSSCHMINYDNSMILAHVAKKQSYLHIVSYRPAILCEFSSKNVGDTNFVDHAHTTALISMAKHVHT